MTRAADPNNPEWYTPHEYLKKVYLTLGKVTLDPCCNLHGAPNVVADKYYRFPVDGLLEPWGSGYGLIFMNPPYGRVISKWTKKLLYEYQIGNINSAIALIPVKTETQWWDDLMASAVCWCAVKGRIRFKNPWGENNNFGTFASALVLLSNDLDIIKRFKDQFSNIGTIWTAIK